MNWYEYNGGSRSYHWRFGADVPVKQYWIINNHWITRTESAKFMTGALEIALENFIKHAELCAECPQHFERSQELEREDSSSAREGCE